MRVLEQTGVTVDLEPGDKQTLCLTITQFDTIKTAVNMSHPEARRVVGALLELAHPEAQRLIGALMEVLSPPPSALS